MNRNHNTNKKGGVWTDAEKISVWNKGTPIEGFDNAIWRRDKCGRAMKFAEHGNRNSEYGWEIDHIIPVARGGDDNIDNLQPLYWENNAKKSDLLNWMCN